MDQLDMARYWTQEQKNRAKRRAYAEHRSRILADPEKYSRLKVERYLAGPEGQGFTQAELGEIRSVGLHASSISALERGSKGNRNTRGRIAYALGKSPDELFAGKAS